MSESITARSYAKINWTLEVLYRRDDGYHELRTIFQTVSIYDVLKFQATSGPIEIVSNNDLVPCDESNLAYKAAAKLRESTGVEQGAVIEIDKRIPVAAGLGGGSSNAATTLLALARLWQMPASPQLLFEIAASLGSDVPFFLYGGTALGIGRGEEVYSIRDVEDASLLLVNPGFAVPTAGVYSKLKRLTSKESNRIIPFALLAANGICELTLAARNDLEEVVLAAHPELQQIKLRLIGLGARQALVSGSGATVFGVFDNLLATVEAARELGAAGLWCEPVRTIGRDEYQSTIFE